MNNWNIEVSEEMYIILSKIFETIGLETPSNITSKEVEKVLKQMTEMIKASNGYSKRMTQINTNPIKSHNAVDMVVVNDKLVQKKPFKNNNVLIISKLGIIRYQLRSLLNHFDLNIVTIDSNYSGLAEYVKKLYEYVIFDITDNVTDALAIAREIKRIASKQAADTKIMALTCATKSHLMEELLGFGIDKVIIKQDNWQSKIVDEIQAELIPVLR